MHIGMLQLYGLPEGARMIILSRSTVAWWMWKAFVVRSTRNCTRGCRAGGCLWITDENFDIDYRAPFGTAPSGPGAQVLAFVSRLHAQRLDPRRPLWECYLIEGLEGNRFAVYNKMHHAMMDGAGGMNLLQSRMSTNPGDSLPPPWSSERNTRLPRKRKKKMPAPVGLIKSLRNVQRTSQFVDLMRQPKESNIKTIYQAPKTVFNHRVTGARRFAAQSWSLDRIKVAEQHDGTAISFWPKAAAYATLFVVAGQASP